MRRVLWNKIIRIFKFLPWILMKYKKKKKTTNDDKSHCTENFLFLQELQICLFFQCCRFAVSLLSSLFWSYRILVYEFCLFLDLLLLPQLQKSSLKLKFKIWKFNRGKFSIIYHLTHLKNEWMKMKIIVKVKVKVMMMIRFIFNSLWNLWNYHQWT